MQKQFQTERAIQQQKRINDSLISLMLEKPYSEITVQLISERANIPRRMFYYYYDGKDQVFDTFLLDIFENCDLEVMFLSQPDRAALEQSLVRFFYYWRDRKSTELTAILSSGLGNTMLGNWVQWISQQMKKQDCLSPLSESDHEAQSFLGAICIFHALSYWQTSGFLYTPEQIARHVTKILTEPLYPTT